jgi:protein O-GlcNAc transferase
MLRRLIEDLLGKNPRADAGVTLEQARQALQSGSLDSARSLCDIVLTARPADTDALHLAGTIAYLQGDRAQAIAWLTRAAQSDTDAQPSAGLGQLLLAAGRLEDATKYFERAVRIDPQLYAARMALASALYDQGRQEEAEAHLRCAIALQPESVEAHRLLTALLHHQARQEELAVTLSNLQRVRPTGGNAIHAALLIPTIYRSIGEIEETRARMVERLDRLLDGPALQVADPISEIQVPPFYLAYHGMNDRDLQQRIARLCRKAYRPLFSAPLKRAARNGRIRVGFISEHFNSHSVGRVNHGLIAGLPRDRFDVTVFSLGRHDDWMAQLIRADSDHYVEVDRRESLPQIERVIAGHEMDVLLFTDVGMDPLTYFLAYSRLAPLQCVCWGHPDTTGIDTLDCYISAAALELPEADSHYTEKLVRLPAWIMPGYLRPGTGALALPAPRRTRADYGLDESAHVYVCPQQPFKIHPDFDQAIAAILRGDPEGVVVLVEGQHPRLTQLLRERFEKGIGDVAKRISILPHMRWADYLNLIAVSDVALDPFHFGGANTTYEALAMGVPVVTLPPPFLRGRHSLGCYLGMEMSSCVAAVPEEYARIALELGREADFRQSIAAEINERSGILYGNGEMARALGEYLASACLATR